MLIDAQFARTSVVVGLAFVAVQLALAFAVWWFSRRSGTRSSYSLGNAKVDATWTLLTLVVFVTLAITGERLWSRLQLTSAAAGTTPVDAVRVNLVAQQFQFTFHYNSACLIGKLKKYFSEIIWQVDI